MVTDFHRTPLHCVERKGKETLRHSCIHLTFFTLVWRSCTNSLRRLCSVCSSLATVSSSPLRSCRACSLRSWTTVSSANLAVWVRREISVEASFMWPSWSDTLDTALKRATSSFSVSTCNHIPHQLLFLLSASFMVWVRDFILASCWVSRRRPSFSSFSLSSMRVLRSVCLVSRVVHRWTRFFTSDRILEMYRRATVNSSSTLPSTSPRF
ncbi:hypothetical protein E2C01_020117 [Portunus trituberculatus]|uniref:Uncharacterized protein n=1 Tax=Portunus trituberculatus TaxID=210409 RepID=A0A5B7E193_PORTR|nr:hypothetical protein [Portunus trituberculatus]